MFKDASNEWVDDIKRGTEDVLNQGQFTANPNFVSFMATILVLTRMELKKREEDK